MLANGSKLLETAEQDSVGQARPRRRVANNSRKELVRERMLEKSAELFCANGFSKTSINELLRD